MCIEASSGWPASALSVSLASNIRPAHVPQTGNPSRIRCCNGSCKPYNTINFPMAVLSPPGNIIPSKSVKCLGSLTAIPSTPSSASIFRCASKSPCNAKTPMRNFFCVSSVIIVCPYRHSERLPSHPEHLPCHSERSEASAFATRGCFAALRMTGERNPQKFTLPPAPRHLLALRQLIQVDANHWLAQVARDFGDNVGVLEMRGSAHDGLRAFEGVARFEDAGPDEDAFRAQPHHQGSVGGSCAAASREIDDGQFTLLRYLAHQFIGRAQVFRLGHQLLFGQHLQAANAIHHGAHVTHRFNDVAGASLRSEEHT